MRCHAPLPFPLMIVYEVQVLMRTYQGGAVGKISSMHTASSDKRPKQFTYASVKSLRLKKDHIKNKIGQIISVLIKEPLK